MGSVVNATSRPLYSGERPGTHMQDAGWTPRPVWTGKEKFRPQPGFDSRTFQPVASRLPTELLRTHDMQWYLYAMVSICNGIDMQWHRYKINQKICSLDKANSYQIYKLLQLYLTTRLAVCGPFRNLLLDY
jgi:hypothetical protein